MKAFIKFDFAHLFLYKHYINEDDCVEVDYNCLSEMKKGDKVEILKVVDSEEFSGGKGYVIYNPRTHQSRTVAYHTLEFTE